MEDDVKRDYLISAVGGDVNISIRDSSVRIVGYDHWVLACYEHKGNMTVYDPYDPLATELWTFERYWSRVVETCFTGQVLRDLSGVSVGSRFATLSTDEGLFDLSCWGGASVYNDLATVKIVESRDGKLQPGAKIAYIRSTVVPMTPVKKRTPRHQYLCWEVGTEDGRSTWIRWSEVPDVPGSWNEHTPDVYFRERVLMRP